MQRKVGPFPILLFAACAVVGALAALGKFNSMVLFPVVFAAVCSVLGLVSLWRDRGKTAVVSGGILVLLGVAFAVGGWAFQVLLIKTQMAAVQEKVMASLGGSPAPALVGIEPLNTDAATLAAAASFASKATIISFWATWCSPCWAEMAELDELYDKHRDRGLMVLAITQYDHLKGDEVGLKEDRDDAERFLRKRGYEYPAAIVAGGGLHRAYEVWSIPSAALVDGSGTLVGYAVGLDAARALMAKAESIVLGGVTPSPGSSG